MSEIIKAKEVDVEIFINNKNVTRDLRKYLTSIVYTDYHKGESDELEITLKDSDSFFISAWNPQKGDKISAKIGYKGEKLLNCGVFTIDEKNYESSDDGNFLIARALAVPITKNLKEKRHIAYNQKTLVEIASEIGKRHGFKVAGSQGFAKIEQEAQFEETDLGFLNRISSEYGYIFKITDNILTFIKCETLEQSAPINRLTRKEIERINFTDTSVKTYSSVSAQYFNPKSGKLTSVTVRGNKDGVKSDTLKLKTHYGSKAQAEANAKAALKSGSLTIKADITLKGGNPSFVAGINAPVEDYGVYNGNYLITQSVHEIREDSYNTRGTGEKNG